MAVGVVTDGAQEHHGGARVGPPHLGDQGTGLDVEAARAMEAGETNDAAGGLGVAVVIRLVERLQGRVAVEARAGSGTRISLTLPLQEKEATP